MNSMKKVTSVVLCGGTHGNERNGIEIVRFLKMKPEVVKRKSFSTQILLTNEKAIEQNVRYCDVDLNRCFLARDLSQSKIENNNESYEQCRALEINSLIGPKSSQTCKTDFLIDLHNTTANTTCLCMAPNDYLSFRIGASVLRHFPTVHIVLWTENEENDWSMLPTVAKHGLTLEVGPVSWGCVDSKTFHKTLSILQTILNCLDNFNTASQKNLRSLRMQFEHVDTDSKLHKIPCYKRIGAIDFPRLENGKLAGGIHENLQGRDFHELIDGDPMFRMFDGAEVLFQRSKFEWIPSSAQHLYPIFVNEAAYYEKRIALVLCIRDERQIELPNLAMSSL